MKLVASDLDGTLLNAAHRISPYTQQVLQDMVASGVTFVFATGRHFRDVQWLHDQLPIPAWKISANGAQVVTPKNEVFRHHTLTKALVEQAIVLTSDMPVSINLYTDQHWFTNRQEVVEYSEQREFDFTAEKTPLLGRDDVIKIFFMADHDALLEVEARLNQEVTEPMAMAFSLPTCLEIMAPKVNKGVALTEVCQHLGVDIADAWAFGDGMNDVEMLTAAGKGFVMQNALERVKAALPQLPIIGHHNDDGVAKVLAEQLQR
ncbi:Cof-type HAD-IIB family hydrolase [Salinibius halmophilus]|uniref:Cof-type HAD-IIB family hydrolase n=1 Tax=Salinibius halmophilus TaxID=1853216 RepID=UPI000E6661C8|nr:Cof-type HAD-IIB family hydrolase [Salinibius halmophilus]